jgi:hypothetical protein
VRHDDEGNLGMDNVAQLHSHVVNVAAPMGKRSNAIMALGVEQMGLHVDMQFGVGNSLAAALAS